MTDGLLMTMRNHGNMIKNHCSMVKTNHQCTLDYFSPLRLMPGPLMIMTLRGSFPRLAKLYRGQMLGVWVQLLPQENLLGLLLISQELLIQICHWSNKGKFMIFVNVPHVSLFLIVSSPGRQVIPAFNFNVKITYHNQLFENL